MSLLGGSSCSPGDTDAAPDRRRPRTAAVAREQVSLEGTVEHQLDDHVFLLRGHDPVLVAHRGPDVPAVGAAVTVTGFIDRFERRAIEAELDVVLPDALAADLAGRPCVVATVVRAGAVPRAARP